ncbi:DNA recombination protein RmuC [Sanguibacter keddieii]|uniref:DNA recombination protein RmuC n=1 Tax=Sanguibacter keddieii TaxID=60920 RepID=UPI0006613140|nr:DNA recombination protein RmuC [Sanguibacter keddieii]
MGMSLVFLLVGLVVGALLGYVGAVARRASTPDQAGTLRAEVARWQARAEELSRRVESAEARSQGDASVLQALAPVRAQLEQMTQRVDQMEQIRARQHGALAEQLRESARRETELARTTASLEGALRSRSARGTWGEVELARILEVSGMMPHVDFAEQRSIGSLTQGRGRGGVTSSGDLGRPDVTIHLPGQGFLALDAKAPMDAYLRACAIEDSGEDAESRRRAELSAHAKALRSHVDALAGRDYAQSLGASPELVILFVPSEAALSAALHADASLLDDAMARGVALCSPVTLLAVARTCATAWARTSINEQADQVIALGRELYERLGVVAGHMENLGKHLAKTVDFYNKTVSSMESRLLASARSVSALEEASKKTMTVTPIDPDAAQVRSFTKPELTDQ